MLKKKLTCKEVEQIIYNQLQAYIPLKPIPDKVLKAIAEIKEQNKNEDLNIKEDT